MKALAMKTSLKYMFCCLFIAVVLTGCHLFFPNHGEEGEGEPEEGEVATEGEWLPEGEPIEYEGETVEGEIDEGEPVDEGEAVEGEPEGESAEGEAELPEFVSADTGYDYRNAPGVDYMEPEEGTEEGETERELVEPDVIRRSSNLLYVLNQYRGLTIVNLDNETLLSQTPTVGYPRDLYLVGNKAYVLVSYAQEVTFEDGVFKVRYGSKLYLFDITDPENVAQESVFSFNGDLVDSRMVGSILYAVCSDYSYYEGVEEGVVIETASAEKSYGMTWAVSVDTADPEDIHVVKTVGFEGYGNLIQATDLAIFTVTNDYDTNNSLITYIDIDDPDGDMIVRGTAAVEGYMADRFKMDTWNGALRVVTNTWTPARNTLITTLDLSDPDTMAQLGQTLLASASGETVYATRFDGPRAYIVTYLTKDPLFVVDLSDPSSPRVSGELEIPGWSTHIEPRGDRLVALGVDDQGGWRVMVSLFDVSDPAAPLRLDYASFGDGWSWSSAYGDVKALSVFDDVILAPFSGWNYGSGGYDRLQFVSWDREGLEPRGFVDLQGSVVRSFTYSGGYYAVTQEQLAVIDAEDLAVPIVENTLSLAENVADLVPLDNGLAVEIISRYDTNDTLLRIRNQQGVPGASITLPVAGVSAAFAWNQSVAVVSAVYEYEPAYRSYCLVSLVDFSVPETPELIGKWQADLEPWYGGWWWGPYYPEMDVMKSIYYYPWYYSTGASAVLAGDYLVLRGYGSVFDTVVGDAVPWQGLAVMNLAIAEEVDYLGLGYDKVAGIDAADGLVYLSTEASLGLDAQQRPVCAYYMQTLDPALMQVSDPVNVPGVFQHKLPQSDVFVLKDTQYGEGGEAVTLLRSGTLDEKKFNLIDSARLPFSYGDIRIDGNFVAYLGYHYDVPVYVDPYVVEEGESDDVDRTVEILPPVEPGYTLGTLLVSGDGLFTENEPLNLGSVWCSLLGVKNSRAFLSVSGAAVACFDFNVAPPELTCLSPVMGYPSAIRFDADNAYLPLGYSGALVLPL